MTDALPARVSRLEASYATLREIVARIELEQSHIKSTLDSRFRALDTGQDLCVAKIDGLHKDITIMAGDAAQSPAGRAVMKELEGTRERLDRCEAGQQKLQNEIDEARGAVKLAKSIGISSLLGVIAVLAGLLARVIQ